MELYLIKYINKMLKNADYEYDSSTNSWCASVDKLPGVYAQADTIEDVRSELAEIIEEYESEYEDILADKKEKEKEKYGDSKRMDDRK